MQAGFALNATGPHPFGTFSSPDWKAGEVRNLSAFSSTLGSCPEALKHTMSPGGRKPTGLPGCTLV